MSYLVFDLETITDLRLPKPEVKECSAPPRLGHYGVGRCKHLPGQCPSCGAPPPDPFLPPSFHKIVALGYAKVTDDFTIEELDVLQGLEEEHERQAVASFIDYVSTALPAVVGWNSRRFDLPVIAARAFSLGIPFPWFFNSRKGQDPRYKYADDPHYDVKDVLSGYGMGSAASLDVFSKSMGLPGKAGVDGSMVAGMVAEGRLAEVADYCVCDVVQTTGCYFRCEFLRGRISRAVYQRAMEGLVARIAEDARLLPLRDKLDLALLFPR